EHDGHAAGWRSMPTLGSGTHHATTHLIGELGRGQVEDALELAVVHQVLHRASADARGVKDEHFEAAPFQLVAGAIDGSRRVPEHRRGDEWLRLSLLLWGRVGWGLLARHHSGDRTGRVAVNKPADPVQAGNIDHRR